MLRIYTFRVLSEHAHYAHYKHVYRLVCVKYFDYSISAVQQWIIILYYYLRYYIRALSRIISSLSFKDYGRPCGLRTHALTRLISFQHIVCMRRWFWYSTSYGYQFSNNSVLCILYEKELKLLSPCILFSPRCDLYAHYVNHMTPTIYPNCNYKKYLHILTLILNILNIISYSGVYRTSVLTKCENGLQLYNNSCFIKPTVFQTILDK